MFRSDSAKMYVTAFFIGVFIGACYLLGIK